MKDWLERLENDNELEILFACEAGSRAWGLSGPFSDLDIRFIYRNRSLRKYLSLNKLKSVIDVEAPYDATGYDIFKAFELLAKSNPSIYEWAYAPIMYKDEKQFSLYLKKVIEDSYSPYSLFKHYGSLSKRNVSDISKGSFSLKKQKQLIQALRAELIRIGIVHTNAVYSPFKLIEIARIVQPDLFDAYLSISAVKKQNTLLALSDAESFIHLLQSSLKETGEQIGIRKQQPSIDLHNNWIWEVLGI